MEDDDKELELLPAPCITASSSSSWPSDFRSDHPFNGPSLDLQLSMSVRPIRPPSDCDLVKPVCDVRLKPQPAGCVEALKRQTAEQIRLAAMEKAYAERMREVSRLEMEMAQSEFSRARHVRERAREEVENAKKMKENAIRRINSTCMEITCQSCRQKFRS